MKSNRKVVISGIGISCPIGEGVEEFYKSLIENKTGVALKSDWKDPEIGNIYASISESISFKNRFPNIKFPFPQIYSQLGMIGCLLALKDAKLEFPITNDSDRIGLIINTCMGANEAVEIYVNKLYSDGPSKVSPFLFTQTVANCAVGDISKYFCLKGVSSLLYGECSVPYGYDLIKDNKADIVVAGGFDQVREISIWSLVKRNILLSYSDVSEKELYLKEIDSVSNKTIIGQASAFIVLESEENAIKRKARIYAEVVDYSTRIDSKCNNTITENSSLSYEELLKSLEIRTQQPLNAIDLYIGNSCLPWQIKNIELEAIKKITNIKKQINYSTIKSKLGETYSSSGELAVAYGAISLFKNVIPGTNYDENIFADYADCFLISKKTKENVALKNVISSCYYIGGNMASILLRRYY